MTSIRSARDAFRDFVNETDRKLKSLSSESSALGNERARMRSEVEATFAERLAGVAPDAGQLRALDERLGGVLGIERAVETLRGRHAELVGKSRSAADKLEQARSAWRDEEKRLRAAEEEMDRLVARSEDVARSIGDFDPGFLAVKKQLDDNNMDGRPEKHFRSTPWWAYLFDRPLVTAGRMLREFEARAGRTYKDVLESDYETLFEKQEDLEEQIGRASDVLDLHRMEAAEIRRWGKSAAAETERIASEVAKAEQSLGSLDEVCTNAAKDGFFAIMDGYDAAFRKAKKPVGNPAMDALVGAGLITQDDLAKVARRGCLGIMADNIQSRVTGLNKTVSTLRDNLTKLERGVSRGGGSKSIRIDLSGIESSLKKGDPVDDALRLASGRLRAEERYLPTVDTSSDMFGVQAAVIWMLLANQSTVGETIHGMPADVSANPMPELPSFDMGSVLQGLGGLEVNVGNVDVNVGNIDVGSVSMPTIEVPTISVEVPSISVDTSYSTGGGFGND